MKPGLFKFSSYVLNMESFLCQSPSILVLLFDSRRVFSEFVDIKTNLLRLKVKVFPKKSIDGEFLKDLN